MIIPNDKFVILIKYFRIIELIFLFILLNSFLVQVIKKFFTKYDLDLILTEYYKKRLESQLKIREIHLNENKSTEFIVLNTSNLL